MRRALLAVTALGAGAMVAMGAVGVATAADQPAAVGGQLARGTVAERVHLRSVGNEAIDVLVQELSIGAGRGTGWHSHPGPAIVVIESGTFTVRSVQGDRCVTDVYGAGDAFVDPGRGFVHEGRNDGDVPVAVTVTYLLPRMAASPRSSAGAPAVCSN